jgi:hypothetical protein
MSGTTPNAASVRRQSTENIKPAIARSVKRSPIPATTPAVNSSFSASTSDVTRVTSRPTGFLSKNGIERRCRCAKISSRRSCITSWPSRVVRSVSPYEQKNCAHSTPMNSSASRRTPVSLCAGTATSIT